MTSNGVSSFIRLTPLWLVAIACLATGAFSIATLLSNGFLWAIVHLVGGLFLLGVGAIAAIMGYGIYKAATSKD